jgi:hypothetical protein
MADQVYRQVLTFNCAGQFAQSIFHWKFEDSGFATTAAAALALLTAWDAAYSGTFPDFFTIDTTVLSQRARRVSAAGGFEELAFFAGPPAGTRAGVTSVAGVCPVAVFYPLDTSRKRGRWFIPGVSSDDLINGRYTVGYKSDINALLGTQFDDLNLVGGGAPVAKFVVYDRVHKTSFVPVLNKLSDTPGTQRRRQRPA